MFLFYFFLVILSGFLTGFTVMSWIMGTYKDNYDTAWEFHANMFILLIVAILTGTWALSHI